MRRLTRTEVLTDEQEAMRAMERDFVETRNNGVRSTLPESLI